MATLQEVRVVGTAEELFQAAASEFASLAAEAVAARGRFTVALSGGSTPRGLYSLLASNAATGIPWDKIFFFWSDERHVPPDNPDSNYGMAREAPTLESHDSRTAHLPHSVRRKKTRMRRRSRL